MFETNDYRAKHVLPKGSILHCEGVSYVIDSVLGAGGTSIVYSATSSDPTDKLRYAIKEVFPQNAYYHRVNGVICPKSIDSVTDIRNLSECRSKLVEEIERGKEVRNKTILAVQASSIRPTSITIEGEFDFTSEYVSRLAIWSSVGSYLHDNIVKYVDMTKSGGVLDVSELYGKFVVGITMSGKKVSSNSNAR